MNARQRIFGVVGALAIGLGTLATPHLAAAQVPDTGETVSKKNKKQQQEQDQGYWMRIGWWEGNPSKEQERRYLDIWVPTSVPEVPEFEQ